MATADKQGNNTGETGFGQPPKGKPWQPGQSGNPKGRPKGVTLSDALRRMLATLAPGKTEQTYAEAIARALCKEAVKGNVLAAKEIADRTEGKPKASLDVEMNVADWRTLAQSHGISEQDVIDHAKQLIQSVDDFGGDESDSAA